MRSDNGFAPRLSAFFGGPHRITGLFCFSCFRAFATNEHFAELFFDKRREKILRRDRFGLYVMAGIAQLPKQMIKFLRQID
jgi:hypothetical protein